MNAFAVDKITSFLHTKRIDSFHYTMFHGLCDRENPQDTNLRCAGDARFSALQLFLNAHRHNEIIQPGLNMVMSERLARPMCQNFGIDFADAVVKCAAIVPYEEGAMSHWDDPSYSDNGSTPQTILLSAAKKTPVPWSGPILLEMLPIDSDNLTAESPSDAFDTEILFKLTGDEAHLTGTKSGLMTHGVLWSDGVHLFREDVFNYLRPFLREDYFTWEKVTL